MGGRSLAVRWYRQVFPASAAGFLLVLAAGRAGATVITATSVDFSVAEQSVFSGVVATFLDNNPSAGPADFTATIDWGDGSPVTAATGIGFISAAFVVRGQHTYGDEGVFTVTVTINDVSPGTGTATATDTATVTEADVLSGTPKTFAVPPGVSFTTTVATFTDSLTAAVPSDFTATIDWGDATTSAGTVTGGGGTFQVSGTHTYAGTGSFPVIVTLTDDAPGTATATVTSTAKVAAGLSVTGVDFSTPEDAAFNGTVANFSDADISKTAASFVVTVDWGDGMTTAGTVTGSTGVFSVSGQHTYTDEGSFTVTVTVTEIGAGGATASGSGTATVTEADVLSGTPKTFAVPPGVSFTTTVATFTDSLTAAVPSDFTAAIDWGDATTSAGTVTGGGGTFQVSGTHTYAGTGSFPVIVTLTDDAPGTATATVTSTAKVAAGLSVTGVDFSTPEHAAFNGTVANFSDADISKTAASFVVTVDWGDGMTTAGTVTGSTGVFSVSGQHTYTDEGSFTVTVTVTEIGAGGATASGSGTATVTEADALSGTPATFAPVQAVPFTGTVATFTDTDTANVASDFTATINWGDGNTTAGTVSGGGGTFTVSGTHTYAAPGSFPVIVTLTDDAPGTATAATTSTANVSPAPRHAIPVLDLRGLLLLALALVAAAFYALRSPRSRRVG